MALPQRRRCYQVVLITDSGLRGPRSRASSSSSPPMREPPRMLRQELTVWTRHWEKVKKMTCVERAFCATVIFHSSIIFELTFDCVGGSDGGRGGGGGRPTRQSPVALCSLREDAMSARTANALSLTASSDCPRSVEPGCRSGRWRAEDGVARRLK